jgi:hypothetical protein
MTVTASRFVNLCLGQKGDRYVFGAEASPLNPNPTAFDCSELVEWAAARAGVAPRVPDGAYYQRKHCLNFGQAISVASGIRTFGSLLFVGDGTGVGRDAITHLAVSLGNGLTIEARGSKWGVGTWSAERGFDFAAKIPGIDYSGGTSGAAKPLPVAPLRFRLGDKGPHVDFGRFCLNAVKPQRKGKLIAATGPVDGAFIAAVTEFQNFCEGFSMYVYGRHFVGGPPFDGILGQNTQDALAAWVRHNLGQ